MDSVAEGLLQGLFEETLAEIGGKSHRKWAVALVALLLGATIATIVVRRRALHAAAADGAQDFSGVSGSPVSSYGAASS